MATYFLSRGDHGDVVIDDDYRNFQLVASGSAVTSATAQSLGFLTNVAHASITSSAIVAIYSTSPMVVIGKDPGSVGVFSELSGQPFDWYVFDLVTAPASNYGLVIRNAASQIVFDALRLPMRVLAQAHVNPATNIGADGAAAGTGFPAIDAARKVAIASMNPAVGSFCNGPSGQGPGPAYSYATCLYRSGSSILGKTKRFAVYADGAVYGNFRTGRALALDVTGY